MAWSLTIILLFFFVFVPLFLFHIFNVVLLVLIACAFSSFYFQNLFYPVFVKRFRAYVLDLRC